jgi:TolA-binding protein
MDKHPDSQHMEEALYWLSKSYINLNEPENAENTIQRLLKNYPEGQYAPLALLDYGLMLKRQTNIKKADSIFIRLQNDYPAHESAAQAIFERAVIYQTLGDTVKAMNLFRESADKFAGMEYSEQSRYRIAKYYRSVNMNDSARIEFEKLAQNDFNPELSAEAHYRLGELWLRDQQFEKAIESFLMVKENFSRYEMWFLPSMLYLGEAYESLEKWQEAKEIYEGLVALNPNDEYGKTAKRRLQRISEIEQ